MFTFTDCWYLTGPTAGGKTQVGIELARLLNAEIVVLDSMTVYRDMNIGTAKPSAAHRQAVRHFLLDIVDPTEDFSISQYLDAAQQSVRDIRARGKEVLFVGGTPLYLKALLRGLEHGPPADWTFRESIEEELKVVGLAVLHERLKQCDPLSAARLHPNDKRRLIRALEYYHLTGRPISHQQNHFDELPEHPAGRVFGLHWQRPRLHERINYRVDHMFEAGLVDEVRFLQDKYRQLGRTASQAVGYCEVMALLRGESDAETTRAAVQQRTRRFARRQETWFRSLEEVQRVPCDADFEPQQIARQILDRADSARSAAS